MATQADPTVDVAATSVSAGASVPPATLSQRMRQLGPGILVSGAIVGTGTITTSIVAGTEHGYTLLWASVTLAVILVCVLQEMAARLTLAKGQPLATLVRSDLGLWASILVIGSILGGNSVYSVGNLNGVAMALGPITADMPAWVWMFGVTLLYWSLLMIGRFRLLELMMTCLVGVMGLTFFANMFYAQPDYPAVLNGMLVPTFDISNAMLIAGLIGTTVVPYNLYLHSAAIIERRWHESPRGFLPLARLDTFLPVIIGGLVTMSIGVVAATVLHPQFVAGRLAITGAAAMSGTLEPLLGSIAYAFFNIGLFAAAISSMPMAALSAAYVTTQSLGMSSDLRSPGFRVVFSLVAWIPFVIAVGLESPPVATIVFAQSLNGMLLPITVVFLLFFINRTDVPRELRNRRLTNLAGAAAVVFVTYLGFVNILRALRVI